MTIRFPLDPRMVPAAKVARRLGLPAARFAELRAALEASGFPRPDPILGTWCLQAVDNWIDARAGLQPGGAGASPVAEMKAAVRARAWQR